MYIRLVAEITSHLFQALTSSLSLSLAPSLFSTFFSFPGPVSVSILSLSLSLSLRPPSIPNPFIPTKSTRARSWVEYRRFREILRKNLHNFRNCLLMLEMKEAAATEWSSESFRLFLYKFSFVLSFPPLFSRFFPILLRIRRNCEPARTDDRNVSAAFLPVAKISPPFEIFEREREREEKLNSG